MIIETTANQFYDVSETGDFMLEHVWNGIAVKKTKDGFVAKKSARITLVRKAGCRMVEA